MCFINNFRLFCQSHLVQSINKYVIQTQRLTRILYLLSYFIFILYILYYILLPNINVCSAPKFNEKYDLEKNIKVLQFKLALNLPTVCNIKDIKSELNLEDFDFTL